MLVLLLVLPLPVPFYKLMHSCLLGEPISSHEEIMSILLFEDENRKNELTMIIENELTMIIENELTMIIENELTMIIENKSVDI